MNIPKKAILQILIGAVVISGSAFYAERLWNYESQCSAYENTMIQQGNALLDGMERGLDKHIAITNTLDRILNLPELIAISVDVERILVESRETADEFEDYCGAERVDNFWRTDSRIDELRVRAEDIGARYRAVGLLPPVSQEIIDRYY